MLGVQSTDAVQTWTKALETDGGGEGGGGATADAAAVVASGEKEDGGDGGGSGGKGELTATPSARRPRRKRGDTWGGSDANEYQQMACYLRYFLAKPHPHVGRKGPVCPFVPKSLKKNILYLTVVRESPTTPMTASEGWVACRISV